MQTKPNDSRALLLLNKRYLHFIFGYLFLLLILIDACLCIVRLLSPLLAEYDQTIEELNQQILMYQVRDLAWLALLGSDPWHQSQQEGGEGGLEGPFPAPPYKIGGSQVFFIWRFHCNYLPPRTCLCGGGRGRVT